MPFLRYDHCLLLDLNTALLSKEPHTIIVYYNLIFFAGEVYLELKTVLQVKIIFPVKITECAGSGGQYFLGVLNSSSYFDAEVNSARTDNGQNRSFSLTEM